MKERIEKRIAIFIVRAVRGASLSRSVLPERTWNGPLALALLAVLVLSACGNGAKGGPGGAKRPKEAAPVRIGEVLEQPMPIQLTTIGAVESYTTVMVKSQVSGELTRVWFNEGDVVKEGQTLFSIDTRPYDVALEQAEANLAKAQAQVEQARASLAKDKVQADNAQVQLARDEDLLPKKMVSKQEYDQVRTTAEALKAALMADEASIKSAAEGIRGAQAEIDAAKLQLDYCTIHAPITGKTGSLQIYKGNLVKANDTAAMVMISQTQPIYVSFTVLDKQLADIRQYMAQGPLEVKALIPQQEDSPATGTLTFVDNTVDRTTGTIRLKATFTNEDNRLWPGQFVDTVLQVTVHANAVVAPTRAIQTGQQGPYAFVVQAGEGEGEPGMTAELRKVVPGETFGEMTAITEGLQPGEKVVTEGHLRVTPGGQVKILTDEKSGGGEQGAPAVPEKKEGAGDEKKANAEEGKK